MDFLADTVFLIDLWRERDRGGPATAFARSHAFMRIGVPWIVAGEFLCGGILTGHSDAQLEAFLERYHRVHSTPSIVHAYARLFADLKKRNQLIGPNDMWIAAAALDLQKPLLTRNSAEFARVPGLRRIDYAAVPEAE